MHEREDLLMPRFKSAKNTLEKSPLSGAGSGRGGLSRWQGLSAVMQASLVKLVGQMPLTQKSCFVPCKASICMHGYAGCYLRVSSDVPQVFMHSGLTIGTVKYCSLSPTSDAWYRSRACDGDWCILIT